MQNPIWLPARSC